MPSRHRYKCLNFDCQSYTNRFKSPVFSAMNSPIPECPECGGQKVEDWGEDRSFSVGSGMVSRIDSTLRSQAEHFGLSDINNKDGKPAKVAREHEGPGKYGELNIFGVKAPVNDSSVTVSGGTATPVQAGGVPTSGKFPGSRMVPQSMTVTHANHKG